MADDALRLPTSSLEVEKGRAIYAGIQKFVAFIMSVHIAEVGFLLEARVKSGSSTTAVALPACR